MAYAKIKASAVYGAGNLGDVILGPILTDGGSSDIGMSCKTASGTITTPTAVKLQVALDDAASIWGDVASGTLTASSSSSTVVNMAPVTNVIGRAVRVVSGAAFAAGTATLYLFGIEK